MLHFGFIVFPRRCTEKQINTRKIPFASLTLFCLCVWVFGRVVGSVTLMMNTTAAMKTAADHVRLPTEHNSCMAHEREALGNVYFVYIECHLSKNIRQNKVPGIFTSSVSRIFKIKSKIFIILQKPHNIGNIMCSLFWFTNMDVDDQHIWLGFNDSRLIGIETAFSYLWADHTARVSESVNNSTHSTMTTTETTTSPSKVIMLVLMAESLYFKCCGLCDRYLM